jgi:hypothetical protein
LGQSDASNCVTLLVENAAGDALKCFPIFIARSGDNVRRKSWRWRLLVPSDALEIVADELLVERRLNLSGRVLVTGPEARGIGRECLVNPNKLLADQAELKFGVGDYDAPRSRVLGGMAVDGEACIAQALSQRV